MQLDSNTTKFRVGRMSNETFQLVCTAIINQVLTDESDDDTETNLTYSASLIEPCYIRLYEIISDDCKIQWDIQYNDSDNEISVEILVDGPYYDDDDDDELIRVAQKLLNERERIISKCLADLIKIDTDRGISKAMALSKYSYGLNPISCIDRDTGRVEHICLTLYCTVQNADELLPNEISRNSRNGLTANEEGILAFSHKYGFSNVYSLTNNRILGKNTANELTEKFPICAIFSLIADGKIKINTPLYVKDEHHTGAGLWMFVSTDGIIYGENQIKAPMEAEFDEREIPKAIVYRDGNKTVKLPIGAEFKLLEEIDGEIKIFDFRIEKTSKFPDDTETADDQLLVSLKHRAQQLGPNKYFDGTVFKAQLTQYEFDSVEGENTPDLSIVKDFFKKVMSALKALFGK